MEAIVQAILSVAKAIGGGTGITGQIVLYGATTAPVGWLICDGSAVSRTTYAALFAILGTTYGAGDGSTTFNLPNLQGRMPVGKNGGTFNTLGGTGGAETVTLGIGEIPPHTHTVDSHSSTTVGGAGGTPIFTMNTTAASAAAGGGGSHNNLPPYQVFNFVIKA